MPDIETKAALPGVTVPIGSLVTPGGAQGPAGSAGGGAVWGETPTGTINGSNTTFTTSQPYLAGLLAVFLNGVRQRRPADYSETTNQAFQFVTAPLSGDVLSIDYFKQ